MQCTNAHTHTHTQRLLTHFRVNELKELLRKLSQSQRGRKAELFQRANEILRHGSPKIQIHIREIYQRNHDTRHTSYSRGYCQRSPAKNLHLSPVIQSPQQGQGYIVHPDVKFKAHPFFNKLETIIRPTALGEMYSGRDVCVCVCVCSYRPLYLYM